VLDEHLPLAVDLLSDIVLHPAFPADEIEREKKVILEEFKMVEDTPDDLVHEVFTEHFWEDIRSAGRFSARARACSRSRSRRSLLLHRRLRGRKRRDFRRRQYRTPARSRSRAAGLRGVVGHRSRGRGASASVVPQVVLRMKDIEQSHLCIGTSGYPQHHDDRYVSYILNTVLGGSMSSRLFQNIREKRGLAYSVFSSLASYRDAGALTIYAGCGATRWTKSLTSWWRNSAR